MREIGWERVEEGPEGKGKIVVRGEGGEESKRAREGRGKRKGKEAGEGRDERRKER